MLKKPTLHCNTTRRDGSTQHFFGSSAATWLVTDDLADLIAALKRESYPFNVWLVPGPSTSDYRIESYAPQVDGAVWLCSYNEGK